MRLWMLPLSLSLLAGLAGAQTSTFHYQGRLKFAGQPVTGTADFQFSLFEGSSGGSRLGLQVENDVPVVDGVFSVELDFGPGAFDDGGDRHLEIEVRYPASSGTWVLLGARQRIVSTPYAVQARGLTTGSSGTFTLDGDVSITGNATVGQTLLVDGASRYEVATFRNTTARASADGVVIQIDTRSAANPTGELTRENNFLTFLDGLGNVVGRVEGFGSNDVTSPLLPLSVRHDYTLLPGRLPSLTFSGGNLPSATLDPGSLPTLDCNQPQWPQVSVTGGRLPDLNWDPGSFPNIGLDRGTLPSLSWTYVPIGNYQVPISLNWDGGTRPSLSVMGGQLPIAALDPGRFPDVNLIGGTLPSCNLTGGSLPSLNWDPGTPPTFNFDPGQAPGLIPTTILPTPADWQVAMGWSLRYGTAAMLAAHSISASTFDDRLTALETNLRGGVIYGSKGADYAEWLPKQDPERTFSWGHVVGVRDGKVTYDTRGAEQLMVVSYAPIVVGNTPPEGQESEYVRVAFMGQVPVMCRGHVNAGDYILPSGEDDGTAIAIAPEDLTFEHLERIVGRAWTDSPNDRAGLVTVAVGLDTHATARVLRNRREREMAHERDLARVVARNDNLEREVKALRANQREMLATQEALIERLAAMEERLEALAPLAEASK